MMKRKLLLLMMTLGMMASRANGQVLISLLFGDALNSDKISFGLTGGAQFSTITNLEDNRFYPTFNLGFFFDIRLSDDEHWYFHPEVLVKSTMGTRNLLPYPTSEPELDSLLQFSRVERRINYFNVPLLIKYRFNNNWGVETGPQFSLRSKAVDEFKGDLGNKEELILRKDIRDQIDRLDAGFAVGVSRRLGESRTAMVLYGRYYFGFIDIDNLTEGKQANQSFLINVTIPIGAGQKETVEQNETGSQNFYNN